MSEPIPEAIPTSADPRSHRPTKRRALTPRAGHASQVEALFAKPDKVVDIPSSALSKHTSSAPPEIVANVQGSSAGAGSGEFHVYKASRRREYERLRAMDDEVQREVDEKEFLARKAEQERRDGEKTEKNRAKRAKALARKMKAKSGGAKGGSKDAGDDDAVQGATPTTMKKKKLVPNAKGVSTGGAEDADAETGEVRNSEEIGLVIEDDD